MGTTLRRLLWEHPVAWGAFAVTFFAYVSRLPADAWNVEILIARNLLRGHGFVVGPMDPPALWRPPLAVLALLPIEVLVEDPRTIYRIFATLCLSVTTVVLFYLMKRVGGVVAAHFSQPFAFSLPAFITLVNRQFSMLGHLIMLAAVVSAILVSLEAWENRRRRHAALAGLLWGLAFLARPETSLLFGATITVGFFAFRRRSEPAASGRSRLAIQFACFLVVCVPAVAVFEHVRARHGLTGQVPLMTFYAGEYLASNTPASDPDGQGYAEGVSRFGPPERYGNSLVRFALAHPAAVLTRIRQNIGNTIALLSSGVIVRPADWLIIVICGAALTRSTSPSLSWRCLLAYGALLSVASLSSLVFHVEPRYLLLFVLVLLIAVQAAAMYLWRRLGSRWRVSPRAVTISLVLVIGLSAVRVIDAVSTARSKELDIDAFYALAHSVRAAVGPSGIPSVGFTPPNSDATWISYFVETAIPWRFDASIFPRDRVYSFTKRAEDYLLAPASINLRDLGDPPVLWRATFSSVGEYVLLDLRGKAASP